MEHVAAANGVARHKCDDHLGHRADEFLHLKHVEARHTLAVNIAAVAAHRLVAAGAKGILAVLGRAGAGEKNHANGLILAGIKQRVVHLRDGLGAEGVALLRPVDGDASHAGGLMV